MRHARGEMEEEKKEKERTGEGGVRTLLVDNYDSYTFNLWQYLASVNGQPPWVIRNDQLTWEQLRPLLPLFHNVVISPGPGVPSNRGDLLREGGLVPVLGVCLGHQAIAHVAGGRVVHAPCVAHGVVSTIEHTGDPLFANVPTRFKVVRYHSWVVDATTLPESQLQCIASTSDGLVMALRHTSLPLWGVQFHPESICTEYGKQILENFRDLSLVAKRDLPVRDLSIPSFLTSPELIPIPRKIDEKFKFRIKWKRLTGHATRLSAEEIFSNLFASSERYFWLDSSFIDPKASRFSYMGSSEGPHSKCLTYRIASRQVVKWKKRNGNAVCHTITLEPDASFFDFMDAYQQKRRCCVASELPFDFTGGFVGYFGYEMKHECGAYPDLPTAFCAGQNEAPDAAFLFADRFVAFDHLENSIYLLCLEDETEEEEETTKVWFAQIEHTLSSISPGKSPSESTSSDTPLVFTMASSYETYKDEGNILACLEQIELGESYELCLTNKVNSALRPDPLMLYLRLRNSNPAPFASFLRLDDEIFVLCSSPEKFISVDHFHEVECKPIKGTAPRGATPEEDEHLKEKLKSCSKNFSENLMIVDLIRNDIGRVCEINSVHVPTLMNIESYATVHQLVTTVRGRLRPGLTAIDGIRHTFPPGSMTGAPKLRSMQILNRIEGEPRGIYSGIIGYLSVTGAASFNVVIRTAIIGPQGTTIGCGGAIVAGSNIEEEFDEMLLKANRLITTICESTGGNSKLLSILGVPANKFTFGQPSYPQQFAFQPTVSAERSNSFSADSFLRSLSIRGMDLGVGRIRAFLASIGEPQNCVRAIHVTGTNGKGSVCAFLTAILKHAGFRVGRYISPHLVNWRECITVNEQMIPESTFDTLMQKISLQMQTTGISLTQFEALTAAAYCYFYEERVDISVVEVGLGGENDATNVLDQPLVSIITSISLDHTEILGPTHNDIARQKAGIIKQGRPVLVSESLPSSALAEIAEIARSKKASLHVIPSARWEEPTDEMDNIQALFIHGDINVKFKVRLNGDHQLINSALAVAAVLHMIYDELPRPLHDTEEQNLRWNSLVRNININTVVRGVERVNWPGRVQWVMSTTRRLLLDGSHNAEGGARLREFVMRQVKRLQSGSTGKSNPLHHMRLAKPRRVCIRWIVGMLGHKDHIAYLRSLLLPRSEDGSWSEAISFIEVKPNVEWLKPYPPENLLAIARELESEGVVLCDSQVASSVGAVLGQLDILEASGDEAVNLVVVCGSLHLCGVVLEASPQFHLLETLRWQKDDGFTLLDYHLERLAQSSLWLGICSGAEATTSLLSAIRHRLFSASALWSSGSVRRIRILVGQDEQIEVQSDQIDADPIVTKLTSPNTSSLSLKEVRVRLAMEPVLRDDPFVRVKTTHRSVYTRATDLVRSRETALGITGTDACEDVVLFNQFGQITETTIANIAIARWKSGQEKDWELITPPAECGLLAGTLRRSLMQDGLLQEAPLGVHDLVTAKDILLFNSVRGIYRARLLPALS